MKIKDIMTSPVVSIEPGETVEVAARTLTRHNIGALPVCTGAGKLCGVITDRDIVTRCLAANRLPARTKVREVMTSQVLAVKPDMDAGVAAHLMGKQQVRRLPVVENGVLCGMVSLGDISTKGEENFDAADALTDISMGVSDRALW